MLFCFCFWCVRQREQQRKYWNTSSVLVGSSSSGFTTEAPPITGVNVDAADIAVVVIYFVFVMVVGIWVRSGSFIHFTLTHSTSSALFYTIKMS